MKFGNCFEIEAWADKSNSMVGGNIKTQSMRVLFSYLRSTWNTKEESRWHSPRLETQSKDLFHFQQRASLVVNQNVSRGIPDI